MTTSNALYKKELATFRENIIEMITHAFQQDGEIYPAMFAFSIRDQKFELAVLANIGELFATPATKVHAKEAMQRFAEDRKPIAIAFAVEARARKFNADEYDPKTNTESPEAKDIIMITFETYDMQSVITWEIDKSNPDRMTMLVDVDEDWTEKVKGQGLFNDILQEDYSEIAEELRKIMNN